MEYYSEGQKKKVLLAKSLSEPANLFIWDEPLNYVDILSRVQLEELSFPISQPCYLWSMIRPFVRELQREPFI